MYMNIRIYTVHLFLYKCITCKVKSCLSNYCTFHISYVTTNRQKYKIASMKKIFLVNILSLLLVRPKIFINITCDGFYCHAPGKKSPWILHPSPAMISCDFLTCSIHGIQQRHLILWSMIIYFPPPCLFRNGEYGRRNSLLSFHDNLSKNGSDCAVGNLTFHKN